MPLPLILFGLVCAVIAAAGFWDKHKYVKRNVKQESQANPPKAA